LSKGVIQLVCRCDLPPTIKAVAKELAWFANDDGEDVFPAVETIAARTSYERRTVQKAYRDLEGIQLIAAVSDRRGGRGRATVYKFNMAILRQMAGAGTDNPSQPSWLRRAQKDEPTRLERANPTTKKGERRSPEQYEQEISSNSHAFGEMTSPFGIALQAWLKIQNLLRDEIEPKEWERWVRPAKLLRPMGKTLLIAVPPNTQIMRLAKSRQGLLHKRAAELGWEGIVLTPYPDQYQLDELRIRFPEAYAQLPGALKSSHDRDSLES
jgi:hypothetical protein